MPDINTIGVIAAVVSVVIAFLTYIHMKDQRLIFGKQLPWIRIANIEKATLELQQNKALDDSASSSTEGVLTFFWNYPTIKISREFSEESWAVKESLVLKGDIAGAREKPGLGCAILSVRLAVEVFGETEASGRITQVVNWAMRKAATAPPHILEDEIFYPQDSRREKVQDLRHTIAFAEILALTNRMPEYRDTYIYLTLDSQQADGGWDAGSGATVSELLTALYAVLFLGTCLNRSMLSAEIAPRAQVSMSRGLAWIVNNTSSSHQWQTDIFSDHSWNAILTTAFVLRGMAILGDVSDEGWIVCARAALKRLVMETLNEESWKGTDQIQRFRVETRVAAAIARSQPTWVESGTTRGQIEEYLRGWRIRSSLQLRKLRSDEFDLSTAMYWLESANTLEELRAAAKNILQCESTAHSRSRS